MHRLRLFGTAVIACSLLLLLLMISSRGVRRGSASVTTPNQAQWSIPTPISMSQPNSSGSMVRANLQGTGIYVTRGVRQLTDLRWKFKTTDGQSLNTPVI